MRRLFFLLTFLCAIFLISCAKKQAIKPVSVVPVSLPAEEPETVSEPQQITDEPDARGGKFRKSEDMLTIYFDYDRWEIRDSEKKLIAKNAEYLKKNPAVEVQLSGHCDERGTPGYNLALGQKRATAVRNYLVLLGAAGGNVSTISYGKEMPVCAAHTEACWAKNRRVEFLQKY